MAAVGDLSAESLPFKDVTWKIPDFFHLRTEDGYCVESPAFFFANAAWRLRLHPNGSEEHSSIGYIDLMLIRKDSWILEHRIHYKIGLKTRNGQEYVSFVDGVTINDDFRGCGVVRYLKRPKVVALRHILVPNGTATVFCRMRAVEGTGLEAFSQTKRPESSLREEFESCWQAELQQASSQTGVSGSLGQTEVQGTFSKTEVPESSYRTEVQGICAGVQKLQLDYNKLTEERTSQRRVPQGGPD